VGVRCEHERAGIRKSQDTCDSDPQFGHDPSEDVVPFVVHQTRRVLPVLKVRHIGHVRPRVMTVGGEVEPFGIGGEEPLE
jgi:hypothetical protein